MKYVAHGESWEVAASRAFSKFVKEIVEEYNNNANARNVEGNGTIALQYTSVTGKQPAITIPLPITNGRHQQLPKHHVGTDTQESSNSWDVIRF